MLAKIIVAELVAIAGNLASIILKMNALSNTALAKALVQEGRAGVEVDLITRGACILPVDAPGLDGRIRVRSIIGRLLEHSRVFYFKIDTEENMWLASADWMNRNMMRRVEIAWPIYNINDRARILLECCQMSLDDNKDSWLLGSDGVYDRIPVPSGRVNGADLSFSAQQQLLKKYAD